MTHQRLREKAEAVVAARKADKESPLSEEKSRQLQAAYYALVDACDPETILSLLAELDAARKDAERYRWLRFRVTSEEMPNKTGVALDAAIDAALNADREKVND